MLSSLENFLKTKNGILFVRLIQAGLGLLFIYASLDKIWHPGLFAKSIANYRLLPLPLLHISAIVLPWLEMVSGIALLLNLYGRAANIIIAGLLGIFIIAIAAAMIRGLDFNCGCFSVDGGESNMGALKLFQNLGLLLATSFVEFNFRTVQKDLQE